MCKCVGVMVWDKPVAYSLYAYALKSTVLMVNFFLIVGKPDLFEIARNMLQMTQMAEEQRNRTFYYLLHIAECSRINGPQLFVRINRGDIICLGFFCIIKVISNSRTDSFRVTSNGWSDYILKDTPSVFPFICFDFPHILILMLRFCR
jgi:hypothetical protein